jgi:transcriptional regulator with XRE-family HTH domain
MTKDRKTVVQRLRERIKPENRIFVKKNIAISDQIEAILLEKGWSQKKFAKKLEKNESEISKWLSGTHNLTLQSISKMESVLETDIITTPIEACKMYNKVEYITLRVDAQLNESQPVAFEGKPLFESSSSVINIQPEEKQVETIVYSEMIFEQTDETKAA